MRFLIVNLLATALLFIGASTASAMSLTSSSPDAGPELAVGDLVSITVSFDTEGQAGITLLSVSVNVDSEFLEYRPAAPSTITSYILYSGKGGYMNAAADPPELRFGTTGQVNIDFVGTDLTNGTNAATGAAAGQQGDQPGGLLATLVFEVVGTPPGDGVATAALSITNAGNTIALAGAMAGSATLGADLNFQVPEPGIASLSLAALLTVGALRTRSRRAQ